MTNVCLLQRGPIYLTDLELAAYDGTNPELQLLVGLNGSIYDVSASPSTYGPEGSYHFFAGKDAARAFLTGCFQEDLTPDLRGAEDVYIPVETEAMIKSMSKGGLKIKRERERRLAKKKVRDGIDNWAKVFRGETGRPYFYVGEITREEGWLEKLPKRTLCAAAEEGRPKDEAVET
jgi:predicted heme/steroid binding protein